jgi:transcriptional regulator with XRE-family HTH domain
MALRAYQALERGEATDPHLSKLLGISRALDVPLPELLGMEGRPVGEEAPKAQAPSRSPSPETTEAGPRTTEEKRREFNYDLFAEKLNKFSRKWENLSREDLADFEEDHQDLIPMVAEAWKLQVKEAEKRLGRELRLEDFPSEELSTEDEEAKKHLVRELGLEDLPSEVLAREEPSHSLLSMYPAVAKYASLERKLRREYPDLLSGAEVIDLFSFTERRAG